MFHPNDRDQIFYVANRRQHDDPMREIDLLLLEDAMRHRNLETNNTAIILQTAALALVGFLFCGMFVHSIMRPDTIVAAAPRAETPANIGQLDVP